MPTLRGFSMIRPAIYLHAFDSELADAWRRAFAGKPDVTIIEEDILVGRADAIVSPANSFGYMDGGIDLAYRRFFGDELQAQLQRRIREHFAGELPVGQATVITTNHDAFKHLVSAPTMRVPDRIGNTVNTYLAFRAALLAVLQHNRTSSDPIRSLRTPGLGTGVGAMPASRAAFQMQAAYEAVFEQPAWLDDASAILVHHEDLRSA
jgi:O-acetyl-ADP-ribose deacetylase (regulator of RNase III)